MPPQCFHIFLSFFPVRSSACLYLEPGYNQYCVCVCVCVWNVQEGFCVRSNQRKLIWLYQELRTTHTHTLTHSRTHFGLWTLTFQYHFHATTDLSTESNFICVNELLRARLQPLSFTNLHIPNELASFSSIFVCLSKCVCV